MNIANYDSTQDAEEATQHPFNGVELRIYSIDGKKKCNVGVYSMCSTKIYVHVRKSNGYF